MTISHQEVVRTFSVAEDAGAGLAGYGQLAPQIGAPATGQVRAECRRCGTHLLAVPHEGGILEGTCPVCLSSQVAPVGDHHAAA